MDSRGCVLDNTFVEQLWCTPRYENVYLKGYQSVFELLQGLAHYFEFFNDHHPHRGLGYRTPAAVYQGAPVIQRAPGLS